MSVLPPESILTNRAWPVVYSDAGRRGYLSFSKPAFTLRSPQATKSEGA
ncbi:hypothetical protein NHH03_25810 [Stieleria sp. TO1_6]|nr:hypothetical protein [Stieleria tagensis]MCO8125179.1 hypothetical protein [Stieleria tagensis]